MVYLINKPPKWNDQVFKDSLFTNLYPFFLCSAKCNVLCGSSQVGAYVLNFRGRVTMASVKNFQLVEPGETNMLFIPKILDLMRSDA